jgi:catalase
VLDSTKIIPEELLPLRPVGRLVLNRNPDNFFAETEQVAYCPANIVPGIDFSNDPLLQGRLFSYLDTQKSRLGTANFHQLPINAPKCPMANFQRDGQMQMAVPKGRANYEPNSLAAHDEAGGPRECPVTGFSTIRGRSEGEQQGDKLRVRAELFADHYSQARMFWRSLTENEQAHVASAFTFELSKVKLTQVPLRMVANLRNVDEGLAKRVANGLGLELPKKSKPAREPVELDPSPALSIQKNLQPTLAGRSVGVLFAEGSDGAIVKRVSKAVADAGGRPVLIAPKAHGVTLKDGTTLDADGQLAGTPSQTVDAVAVIVSESGCQALLKDAAAVQFVMDAFGHLKAIGATPEARPLLEKAGVVADEGVVGLDKAFVTAAARRYWARESGVRQLA